MHLTLPADNREYPRLREFVDRACQQADCSPGQRTRVQLVVEELFSNTVKYGQREAMPASVTISVDFAGEHPMTVHYEDDAPRHDAFDQAETEQELKVPITNRRVGGLGIVLVRELGKDVSYSWSGGKNCVTFSVTADTPWPRRPTT
jgi:serine/threonine-protein kinase RsbW/sigma-B regulation protein RsbU (phosphoserine phosphatase)